MKRSLAILVLVLGLLAVMAAPAAARLSWCSTDPAIKLPGNGGVVHVIVAVQEGNQNTPFTLVVAAPSGSQVVGQPGNVEVAVQLETGDDGVISAAVVDAGFPVQLSARYRGNELGVFMIESDADTAASWSLE